MTILMFTLLLLIIAFCAGLMGALTGLGGGVIIIPALVIFFHIDLHYAMGAALIAVIATSSGAAVAYLRQGYTNIRIGILLESGAVAGAVCGALLTAYISVSISAILLGTVLLFSAYFSWRRNESIEIATSSHPWANKLQLNNHDTDVTYSVQRVPVALGLMTVAGILAGLLGIGSGSIKVLAMDQVMRLPYKVATATSNFIIGITVVAGVGVYYTKGYIKPELAFPIMLGVLGGAMVGGKILIKAKTPALRIFFSGVIFLLAVQMIFQGLRGLL